jgi:hypothetical protein
MFASAHTHRNFTYVLALTLAASATPVYAQQTACRSVYFLGEVVPPGCQGGRQVSGVPAYQQWGDTKATVAHAQSPSFFDSDLRYHSAPLGNTLR